VLVSCVGGGIVCWCCCSYGDQDDNDANVVDNVDVFDKQEIM
jgi:hypothetical protein